MAVAFVVFMRTGSAGRGGGRTGAKTCPSHPPPASLRGRFTQGTCTGRGGRAARCHGGLQNGAMAHMEHSFTAADASSALTAASSAQRPATTWPPAHHVKLDRPAEPASPAPAWSSAAARRRSAWPTPADPAGPPAWHGMERHHRSRCMCVRAFLCSQTSFLGAASRTQQPAPPLKSPVTGSWQCQGVHAEIRRY